MPSEDHAATADDAGIVRLDAMEYVLYGRSNMRVSEACVGTMTWGSFVSDESEAHAQLDAAVELGCNFIDTAEMYPVAYNYGATTEKWVGNWLASRVKAGNVDRSKLYIATKCNPLGIGAGLDDDLKVSPSMKVRAPSRVRAFARLALAPQPLRAPRQAHGFDSATLAHSCRGSISRLQCDYIDLYMLHWPSRDTPVFGCAHFYPEGEQRPTAYADEGKDDAMARMFERQARRALSVGLTQYLGEYLGEYRGAGARGEGAARRGPHPPLGPVQRERIRCGENYCRRNTIEAPSSRHVK